MYLLYSIVWGIKHPQRDINDLSLQILLDLMIRFQRDEPHISTPFYQTYLLSLLQDIFYVLTNSFHKSGFKLQTMILQHVFSSIDFISCPLYDSSNPMSSNKEFVGRWCIETLQGAFPHLGQIQVQTFVEGLFKMTTDTIMFKNHVRDFLIGLKEFQGDELFIEEREAEIERSKNEAFDAAMKVPGLIKPSDRTDGEGMMD